ncbi:otefin [Drosophila innubila]|uniref:otefin n=1 Tax=Drosophila innubila TaxID=198719 RepID=UPI00148CD09C|nr:otefin [Drosophila innubila]
MADADNLDALSNAELRAQMLAQGLPNIPVTDSSRKVLVKRLRASLGGNSPLPSSPKKASSRRETMQPAATAAAAVAAAAPVSGDKRDGATSSKARRTIAATPSDTKEAERRRKPETVAALPRLPEATVAKPVAATAAVSAPKAAAPIQTRRVSNTEHRELMIKKPETTVAERATTTTAAVAKQRSPENVLEVNSLIILESDEEEDEQLARAVQNAEDQARQTVHNQFISQYAGNPLHRATESIQDSQRRALIYETSSLTRAPPAISQVPTLSRAPAARTQLGGYDYSSASRSGRYTSYVSSPSTATSSSIGANYRRSPPRTYANEFSDDTAEDEEPAPSQGVKFESDFARKLATLRAERIGDRSSPFNRRSITRTGTGSGSGSGYEPVARRSLRPEDVPVSVAFNRWIQSLDRTYNLKSKLFILFVLILLYFVYKYFN